MAIETQRDGPLPAEFAASGSQDHFEELLRRRRGRAREVCESRLRSKVVGMNQATRSRLVVLLTMTISVVALAGDPVLADVASDYETLFGAEARKVAASRTKTDDAAFAARLLKTAKDIPDSPAMQVLLYEKACQFGSVGTAGCKTALEALGLLEKAIPAKKAQWRQRKLEVVKFRFDKSYGSAKKAAGEPYLEMLEALADAHLAEGNGSEAKALYRRAFMVANYIKSDRVATILAKSKRANAVVAREARLRSLQAKLKKNARDTAAREELILLYVVALDNPAEAAKLLTDDLDEVTRTYVPLAAKKLDDLDEAICLELGDWYYRELSKNASVIGKPVVLQRAKGYYQKFLGLHAKQDIQSFRAKVALASIEKELKKLGARAGPRGRTLTLNLGKGVTMKLVRIPAGSFLMGSLESEKDYRKNEGPQHKVTISMPFYMGVTEVTQEQYEAVMGTNPSTFKGPKNPVESMAWGRAAEFCNKLSAKTGHIVRLPTEAEWEYACRAGTKTRFHFGDSEKRLGDYAWYKSNSGAKTHPVARKKPNPRGLYDMHGNVWEVCRGKLGYSYANAKTTDPQGHGSGKYRVMRGGTWKGDVGHCRSAHRGQCSPESPGNSVGFRVVVAPPAPGEQIDLPKGVTMTLVRIPAGSFLMGSPATEKDHQENEGPQHKVTISKPFHIGMTEVTQEQYQAVMGVNPSRFKDPKNPVECVSWNDAVAFCKKLSAKTRRSVRLPTEAQWEYACRAGTKTRSYFGDDDKPLSIYSWHKYNSGGKTHPVGRRTPNAWGLYDMHGNVNEWCLDWYNKGYYAEAKERDPQGPASGKYRILRSAAWDGSPWGHRSAWRGPGRPERGAASIGFRIVMPAGASLGK